MPGGRGRQVYFYRRPVELSEAADGDIARGDAALPAVCCLLEFQHAGPRVAGATLTPSLCHAVSRGGAVVLLAMLAML